MRITKKLFLILNLVLLFVLLVRFDNSRSSLAADVKSSHFVRVLAGDTPRLAVLGLNAELSIDYGSFRWLQLSQADFDRLSSSKIPFIEDRQAGQIQIMGLRFDPQVDGEPSLPQSLRSEGTRPGFRLVQFVGPIKDEWLEQVETTGATVLQYYPNNAYLVWADPEQTLRLSGFKAVRWSGLFHNAYKLNAGLVERSGAISNIDVMFYNDGDFSATLEALTRLGAKIFQAYPSQPDKKFYDAILQVDASQLDTIAAIDTVLWLGYSSPIPGLDDEMSSQIMAGNYSHGGVPITGYNSWLNSNGINGSGVTWAIIDTGVDYDHPDLGSHIVGGFNFPGACIYPGQPGSDCPAINGGGHGTHVAGIVAANAAGGFADPSGFLYGLGLAPATGIFAMNSLSSTTWPPAGGWQEHSKQAILGNAVGGNNSWTTGEGTNHGYQTSERTHDLMVRDGNFDTTSVAEQFIEVFSAGNSGPGSNSLTAPKEAKNLIVVASSQNYRIGNINTISSFSSRGPSVDGRYVPTITTPGEQIASSRNDVGGDCSTPIGGTNNLYAYCSGTSMASPHASGAVVLITQWWRSFNSGANPSPAMAKALLVNGAVDLGSSDIPNFAEGWGRVNLSNVIQHNISTVYRDQETTLHNTGETWTLSLGVPDPTKPLKITLAWTDAAGAVGANPALVNNLDLVALHGGNTYRGNQFNAGWSISGGSADPINNLENVYLQNPGSSVTITVQAANIAGDGIPYNGDSTDQDFALVCYNCALNSDFTLEAAPASQTICAPASAIYTATIGSILGFTTPVTLNTSGQPAGTTINFDNNPVLPSGQSRLTVGNTQTASAGHYSLSIIGTAGVTRTHQASVGLDLFNTAPGQPALVSPVNGASNQPARPVFTWTPGGQSSAYDIQIATDPDFNNIIFSATNLIAPTYTPGADLSTNTSYYWRVIPQNACGVGSSSSIFNFVTAAAPGDCSAGTLPSQLFNDNFEAGAGGWTHAGTGDTWALSSQRTHSGVNAFKAVDPALSSDQRLVSPPVSLPTGQLPLTLKFWNYQSIESRSSVACWDGGILEVSTDGGNSWSQVLNQQLLTDPYNGLISTTSNPLNGSNAWCGDPQDWLNSVVDISAYAGQTAQFRFRLGSDSSVSKEGWYIDDVVVQSCVPTGYHASLTPANSTLSSTPGSQVIHAFNLHNLGQSDIYTLTLQGGNWPAILLEPSPVAIGAGQQVTIPVQITLPFVPGESILYGSDQFTLTVASAAEPTQALTATGMTSSVVTPGVSLSPATQSRAGLPGTIALYTLNIQNTGNFTDTFSLSLSENTWDTDVPAITGPLLAGETRTVTITVSIPTQTPPDVTIASDTFSLKATSERDGAVSSQASGTTYANVTPGLALTPYFQLQTGSPGQPIQFTYRITNTGNYSDTFELGVSGNAWSITAPTSSGRLNPAEATDIIVEAHIPALPVVDGVLVGSDSFTMTATSFWDTQVSSLARGEVYSGVNPGVSVGADQAKFGLIGTQVEYLFTVTNTGDYTDTFHLATSGVWPVTLSTSTTGPLGPGKSLQISLTVSVPSTIADGDSDMISLTATSSLSAGATAQAWAITTAQWKYMYMPLIGR